MRQAVMTRPGKIEFRDVPVPEPKNGEILLKIKRIGVCGSDIHVWHGKHPYTNYPVIQGHEYSGIIESVGKGVQGLEPGMKATARPQIVCGDCLSCRRGDYHICDSLKVQGFQAPGCAQEYFITTPDRITLFPDSLSYEEGAMVEPTAVAVHSTGRIGDLKGKNVVVLGAGTIGNLVAQVARTRGAQKVLITDISDFRLKIAKRCGIDVFSNANKESLAESSRHSFGEEGFNVAFEAAGVESTLDEAIQNIQKGGTIVVLGVFGDRPKVDMSTMGDHELSLIGTLMYRKEDYEQAVHLLSSGQVQTGPMVTKHFPFPEYEGAYRFIEKQGDKTLKVMIDL